MQERFGKAYVSNISNGEVRIFGKRFYVIGANDEGSVNKLVGLGLVYCHGDEITTWPDSFLTMLWSRLSAPGSIFDGTCNPQGPSHPVKKNVINRASEIGAKVWNFTIDDNPFLDPIFVEQLKRQYQGVWHQRMILGKWVAAEGAIYDCLDEKTHVVDVLPKMLRYWVGVDYGPGSVTTFWLLGLGEDGRLYFVDFLRWDVEKEFRQKSDLTFLNDLDRWLEAHRVRPEAVIVPNDAQSFGLLLQERLPLLKAIRAMAWADQSPGSVLRGIQDCYTLFASGWLRFSRLVFRKGGMDPWQEYVWDPKATERGDDKPLKENDHDPDAGRYAVTHARPIWTMFMRGVTT
jgi:PBSX family phage terminase large subunit